VVFRYSDEKVTPSSRQTRRARPPTSPDIEQERERGRSDAASRASRQPYSQPILFVGRQAGLHVARGRGA